MKMELFQKKFNADHWRSLKFRRYAHALRFAIGLHGAYKCHPIVKNKHYQISSGARASLIKYILQTYNIKRIFGGACLHTSI